VIVKFVKFIKLTELIEFIGVLMHLYQLVNQST